jgi:hypothetical protein
MVFNAIFNNISVISMLYFIKYNNTMKTQIITVGTIPESNIKIVEVENSIRLTLMTTHFPVLLHVLH